MVSDVLIELWKRTNNTRMLERHGILKPIEEPKPSKTKPKKLSKKERRLLRIQNRKGTKPISFRPTKENSDFLILQSDKTKVINAALDAWRLK